MKLLFWRRAPEVDERPDIPKAHADLARIRGQRPDVDALVAALVAEKRMNNFTAHVIITLRGGHA